MNSNYLSIKISNTEAAEIVWENYKVKGEIVALQGEIDFNFKIDNNKTTYLLKISRPDADLKHIEFQQEIINYVSQSDLPIHSPKVLPNVNGNFISKIKDASGNKRLVRLISWMDGRVWSTVNPQKDKLLYSLGEQAGLLTKALQGFDHPIAHRNYEWDIARASWTFEYVHLFNDKQQNIVKYFQEIYKENLQVYQALRKSIVHNDVNDNNVIVSDNLIQPTVAAIIDYGDAVYTQTINDLAITIAYAVMSKTDVLDAALPIVRGYHSQFPLEENELEVLYNLVAMRLIISVTKSAINKQKEPDNKYLLISEKPAWDVLEKWRRVNENLAHYSFREVCGFTAHPNEKAFADWAKNISISIQDLFPTKDTVGIQSVDMSVESTWLGHESEYNDNDILAFKLNRLQKDNPNKIIAGGYLEPRPIYVTDAYKTESNDGPVYRSIHLGVDFWLPAHTSVHALFDGEVVLAINDAGDKEYGGLIILKHNFDDITFYTLYGHQTVDSVAKLSKGDFIPKGDLISYLGKSQENGNWVSHLHFQIMLDLLGNINDFPGVIYPDKVDVWKSICPDPNLLFKERELEMPEAIEDLAILSDRKKHLGKSLSLSYDEPLKIVRGAGVFLMDNLGRKYLDTVNNVAHVGHEHPRVIKAGQEQMALLNTNTRYLHKNITDFAKELLSTFPEELSVVHFVNSGSEANELALRMAKTYSGQKDMIAIEVGYHGNTNACIEISSYKFNGKGGKGAPEYTHIVPLPDVYRGLYQGENTGAKYASHIQEQIDIIQSKERNVAAFICESIISCGGQIELPKDYLIIAYQAVREAGGLCIADEVQVGCGRVGSKFWGFQLHDVIPDIVTIGKPIGNGHPLAAVVCTQEVAEAFANGMEYFNTFGGNPVSCAIGHKVLQVIKDENLQQHALDVGNYLKNGLLNMQKKYPIIGDVRGQGLFLGFELVDENKNPKTKKAAYLVNRMRDFGILMSTDGKDNNVLKIKPPMVFSIQNADELLFRLSVVLQEDFIHYTL